MGHGNFLQFLNMRLKILVKTLNVAIKEGKTIEQPFSQHRYFLIIGTYTISGIPAYGIAKTTKSIHGETIHGWEAAESPGDGIVAHGRESAEREAMGSSGDGIIAHLREATEREAAESPRNGVFLLFFTHQ